MSFNLYKTLKSFLLAAVLLPAIAFANTEYKGTETVNINRADTATLAAYLKGVGANKAEAIVKYRKSNGKFKSVEDLKNVPGIGDETLKDNKRYMSTSRGKTAAPEGYKIGKSSGKSKSTSKKSTTKKTAKKSTAASKSKSTSSSKTADKKSSSKSTAKKGSSKSKSTAKKSSTKASDAKKKTSKTSTTKKKSSKSSKVVKKPKKKKATKKEKTKKKKSSS